MTDLSRRARRALALAFLVLAILTVWLTAVAPLVGLWRTKLAEIARLNEQLGPLREIAGRRPLAERQMAELRDDATLRQGLWSGVSPAAVSAAIQTTVRQAAADSGGIVRSVADASPAEDHRLLRLTVRFDAEGGLETVRKLLAVLQATRPLLFVDTLAVTAPERPATADADPSLAIRLAVSGYMRRPAP